MIIKLLVEGGKMEPGPAVAQQIGPLGLNMGQIISDVNKATESFKGMKVPVELNVDPATKTYTIKVSSPPVSEMLKKELGLEKGSGDHKKLQVGNIAIEQIINLAKTKLPEALENDLKSMIKTIVGSCVSLGIMIDNKPAKQVAEEIENGSYDTMISQEKTEVSPEKKQKLEEFFKNLSSKQAATLEAEEQAEKEAEEKKAEKQATESAEKKPAEKPAKK